MVVMIGLALAACSDLRDYRGTWAGPRVGTNPVLQVGALGGANATLEITALDKAGLQGTIEVETLVDNAAFTSIAGAEADVLGTMTFTGSPLRVYLAFVAIPDNAGDALAVIALYEEHRVELRLLRGGTSPLYAIYSLAEADP
jgi:hypothetical protein